MMRIVRHTVVLAALLTGATAALGAEKVSPKATPTPPAAPAAAPSLKALFRFDCADRRSLEDAGVWELVQPEVARARERQLQTLGDRAVLAELNGDGSPEVFVPVSCGVTCNCTWLIIDAKAKRTVGNVEGCSINVAPAKNGWAELGAFIELDGPFGVLTMYRMYEGVYVKQYSAADTTWEKVAPSLGREPWDTGCM